MNWLTKLLSGVTELNMLKITGVFVATRTSRIHRLITENMTD